MPRLSEDERPEGQEDRLRPEPDRDRRDPRDRPDGRRDHRPPGLPERHQAHHQDPGATPPRIETRARAPLIRSISGVDFRSECVRKCDRPYSWAIHASHPANTAEAATIAAIPRPHRRLRQGIEPDHRRREQARPFRVDRRPGEQAGRDRQRQRTPVAGPEEDRPAPPGRGPGRGRRACSSDSAGSPARRPRGMPGSARSPARIAAPAPMWLRPGGAGRGPARAWSGTVTSPWVAIARDQR